MKDQARDDELWSSYTIVNQIPLELWDFFIVHNFIVHSVAVYQYEVLDYVNLEYYKIVMIIPLQSQCKETGVGSASS